MCCYCATIKFVVVIFVNVVVIIVIYCHYFYYYSAICRQGRVAVQTQGLQLGSADRFSSPRPCMHFRLALRFGMILGPSSLVSGGSRSSIV